MCVFICIIFHILHTHICIHIHAHIWKWIFIVLLQIFALLFCIFIFFIKRFILENIHIKIYNVSFFHKWLYIVLLPEWARIYLANSGNWFLISKGMRGFCFVQSIRLITHWYLRDDFRASGNSIFGSITDSSHSFALSSPFYLQNHQQMLVISASQFVGGRKENPLKEFCRNQ